MSFSGNITKDHITIVNSDTGESGTVNADNKHYQNALSAVRDGDYQLFMEIANPIAIIHRYADDRIKIEGSTVTLDGRELHSHLADRMIDLIQDGFGIEPLANFCVNLYDNPSKRAIDELYGFLQVSDLTITDDGHFVAYKKINKDYKDVYTGKMDNSLGATVQMDRNDVDDDKERTCSVGLHFCGRAYLNQYPGERTMVVKINPKDVVSIPADYQNHKGRTCKYVVIGELENSYIESNKRVTEDTLEGSMYTGEDVTKEPTAADLDQPLFQDDAPTVDDYTVRQFYASRTAARNDARGASGFVFKDFGITAPKGQRWATVMIAND